MKPSYYSKVIREKGEAGRQKKNAEFRDLETDKIIQNDVSQYLKSHTGSGPTAHTMFDLVF